MEPGGLTPKSPSPTILSKLPPPAIFIIYFANVFLQFHSLHSDWLVSKRFIQEKNLFAAHICLLLFCCVEFLVYRTIIDFTAPNILGSLCKSRSPPEFNNLNLSLTTLNNVQTDQCQYRKSNPVTLLTSQNFARSLL